MNIIPYQPGMIPEAGKCYSGMPNDDYHHLFIDWFSSSDLKNALRSVEYFWQEWNRKKNQEEPEQKICFEVGQAHHDSIESMATYGDMRLFDEAVTSYEGKAMSKEFKRVKGLNPKKSVVPIDTFKNIPRMVKRTMDDANFLNIFQDGFFELAFFWVDPVTKIKLKCKTDYIRPKAQSIVDFKTTKEYTKKGYSKDLADYGYHFSAAMYVEGVKQVSDIDIECFIHIATTNTAPFEPKFYPLDNLALEEGDYLFRSVLEDLALKKRPDPKFEDKLGLPFWAITKFDKEY